MARQPNTIHKAEAQIGKPELTLMTALDGRDPRLVALVRLLARRAARGLYEQQLKDHRPTPP
ncbi:hypothetical protein [Gemmobacter caeni]|uniref:hypothetical protein n=1 Tax=Gemmobacter caeni TaxID=589035 RepID=UPI000D3640E2|nr:hypothetical protein [Gemmobacter caeni]